MPNNQKINYIGRVVDRHRQAPISGAKVSLNFPGASSVVYTDLEGIYTFTVKFDDSSTLRGQLTIEAYGYKTYNSFIKLSPKNRDIGDIWLVYPGLESSSSMSNSSMLPLIITAFMVALALILVAVTIPSPQETPVNNRNDRINIYQPSNTPRLSTFESYFNQYLDNISK